MISARFDMNVIGTGLETYRLDTGHYADRRQGGTGADADIVFYP